MRPLVAFVALVVTACSLQMSLPPELAGHSSKMDVSFKWFGEEIRIGPYVTSHFRTLDQGTEEVELLVTRKRDSEKSFTFQLTRDGVPLRDVTCRASRSKSSTMGIQSVDEELRCMVRKAGAAEALGRIEMSDDAHGILHADGENLGIEATASGVVGVVLRKQGHAIAAWQYSLPPTAWIGTEPDAETQATASAAMASAFVYHAFLGAQES
jgi:hypothetical protein